MVEKKHKIVSFIKKKTGSVSVDAVLMIFVLGLMFAFTADLVLVRSTMGKLDNASYSLVSLLRERAVLYAEEGEEKDPKVTHEDLKNMESLAKKFVFGDKDSEEKIYVVLEYWSTKEPNNTVATDSAKCQPYKKLSDSADLSPVSEKVGERRIPLYQVTLCMEISSFFKSFFLKEESEMNTLVRSSSFAVSR